MDDLDIEVVTAVVEEIEQRAAADSFGMVATSRGERWAKVLRALLVDAEWMRRRNMRMQDVVDTAVAYVTEPEGSDMVPQYWHELDDATKRYLAAEAKRGTDES